MTSTNPDIDLKKSAIQSAAFESLLQICLRIISFILNAFITRHVSMEIIGIMFNKLLFLYDTVLFLCREPFRRAALGAKPSIKLHRIVNLIWIGSFVSFLICPGLGLVWSYILEVPPVSVTTEYSSGVILMGCSGMLEILAEVPYILAELQLWVKTKVIIEGLTQLLRSVLLAFVVYYWKENAVLLYGVCHFIGSLFYVIVYYTVFINRIKKNEKSNFLIQSYRQLLPSFNWKSPIKYDIDSDLSSVASSFFKQGWVKEALTKGEMYLMNLFTLVPLGQQGTYQIVNNLGSLAARLVFRSVESAAYKYFTQMVERGIPIREQDQKKMSEVSKLLSSLFRSLILVSLIIVTFGWSYSHNLLYIYGGSKLSDGLGTNLMRAQCFLVVLLAVNGVSEAYTFAVMTNVELNNHNIRLGKMTLAYVVITSICLNVFGIIGAILANCLNMLLRIQHSLWFISEKYKDTNYDPLYGIHLSRQIVSSFIVVFILLVISENFVYIDSMIYHIGIGGVLLVCLLFTLRFELRLLYEKIFKMLDNVILKMFSSTLYQTNNYYKTTIVQQLHYYFYKVHIET